MTQFKIVSFFSDDTLETIMRCNSSQGLVASPASRETLDLATSSAAVVLVISPLPGAVQWKSITTADLIDEKRT